MGKKKASNSKRFVGPREQKEAIFKPAKKRMPTSRAKNGGNTNLEWLDYHRKQIQPSAVQLKKKLNDYWENLPNE